MVYIWSMNLFSSKFITLIFITIFCIVLLPSCSSNDGDVDISRKFRSKYNGTYWGIEDLIIKFSEDKLFSFIEGGGSECYYYEEGSTDSVNFDGCVYHKITNVLLEEDSKKLVFREIYTSGTPTVPNQSICDGGELKVTFQALTENAISMVLENGVGSETYTLIKSSSTFSSNSCSNAFSSGYLLF